MSARVDRSAAATGQATRRERRAAERAAHQGAGQRPGDGGAGPGRRSAQRSLAGMGRSLPVMSAVALVIGVIVVAALAVGSGHLGGAGLPPISVAAAQAPAPDLRDGRSLGDPAAPVSIELFEDPQCAACATFGSLVEPLLVAGPVRDGSVRLTYRDLAFLGPESIEAAAAMRAAETLGGRFWDYREAIFANQHGVNQGAFSRARLEDIAVAVGLDREAFREALADPVHARAVEEESEAARALGVDSTPTLIIDGEAMVGVPAWEDLRRRIATALEAAQPAP